MRTKGNVSGIGAQLLLIIFAAICFAQTPNMAIGQNMGRISWGGAKARSNGVWNQQFINDIRFYKILRFMDWQRTNASPVTSWANRAQEDGITYDLMIELCNTIGADIWLCVPHGADDTFPRELAKLCKSKLNPQLKVWIEYSNETWNSVSPFVKQAVHCAEQARAVGISEEPQKDWLEIGADYTVYRSCQIFEIFKEVYGSEMPSRVRKVVSGFSHSPFRTEQMLTSLRSTKFNPTGITIDAFAIAPYFGAGKDGANLTEALSLAANIHREIGAHKKALTNEYNLPLGTQCKLVAYEGGQHYANNAHIFAAHSEAYTVYKTFLDKCALLMDAFVHLCDVSAWTSGNSFGSMAFTGQNPNDAPKYRALRDWAQEHPYSEQSVSILPAESFQLAPSLGAGVGSTFTVGGQVGLNGRYLSLQGAFACPRAPSAVVDQKSVSPRLRLKW